jgi:hypothetical protein
VRGTARGTARALLAAATGLGAVVATAPPAAAHTVTGVQPTNYRSEVLAVSPPVDGLRLRLLDLGRRVELVNGTGGDVVVLGYQGEPYLRVGPQGTFENRRSPALYLNRATTPGVADTSLPPQADAGAAPSWHRTGSGDRLRWRDRRTRWEGAEPPVVRATPGQAHVVGRWTLALRAGAAPVAATGQIVWVPGPSAVPWLLLALGLLLAAASLGWARRWGPPLSAALAVLVANDVVHSFATAAAAADGLALTLVRVLLGGIVSTAAWGCGIWAVAALQREREMSIFAAAVAALFVSLFGLTDAFGLGRSQIAYAFPPGAARAAVAANLGLGAGLVVAAAVVIRRHPELLRAPAEDAGE